MDCVLLFLHREGVTQGDPDGMAEMGRYVGDLVRRKKLRRGAPLADASQGARVRVRDGSPLVTDGPFAETKELLGGFWVVDVAHGDEAIGIARGCPHARDGAVDVHRVESRVIADSGRGTPFLLAFHADVDPSVSHAFHERLAEEGTLLESASFAHTPPSLRVQARGRNVLVSETAAGVRGYAIVRVASRDAAIEVARHCPHAGSGPVEVREILFFDRT